MSDKLYLSRASLHFWEEPIISGVRGSGTVFFSGCSLKCIYCQNKEISRGESGVEITTERLAEIFLEQKERGAHNINLVTPTHYAPSVKEAIEIAKGRGLDLPIVYNTSSYDSLEALRSLDGYIDVYLADLKYHIKRSAKALSDAENYVDVSKIALDEMYRQVGEARLDDDGMLKRGLIVRVLLLPSHVAEAKLIVKYLYGRFGDGIYLSLMSQYTPTSDLSSPLNRRVTKNEYSELCEYADKLGIKKAFVQERDSAVESFIPPFDHSGVLK